MNREVHVRFWESPEVKVLRATRHPLDRAFTKPNTPDASPIRHANIRGRGYYH